MHHVISSQLFSHESNIRIGRTRYSMIFIIYRMCSTNFESWQNKMNGKKKFLFHSYHQIWNWKWLKLSKSHDSEAQHESFDLHWQYCIWWRILICWMTYFWMIIIFDSNHIKMNINKLTVFGLENVVIWVVIYIVPSYITISLQVV